MPPAANPLSPQPAVNDSVLTRWLDGESIISQLFGTFEGILGINAPHTGIDLSTKGGTDVRNGSDGPATVQVAGPFGGYGNAVMLRLADGTQVLLGHLRDTTVQVGQVVNPGELLGHVDSTGNSTGDHLHFEVRQGGRAVDPWAWLRGVPATAAQAAVSPLVGAGKLVDSVNQFLQPYNWWRLALIALGVGMIAFGLYTYFFAGPTAQVAVTAAESRYRTVPVPTAGA